mmetsp:Transcript_62606/g.149314  ORF Transcript_62606/g.149314 Transcript_62606/m.149314 type:complete len:263 (+) Transcript_62606:1475-2263(+)
MDLHLVDVAAGQRRFRERPVHGRHCRRRHVGKGPRVGSAASRLQCLQSLHEQRPVSLRSLGHGEALVGNQRDGLHRDVVRSKGCNLGIWIGTRRFDLLRVLHVKYGLCSWDHDVDPARALFCRLFGSSAFGAVGALGGNRSFASLRNRLLVTRRRLCRSWLRALLFLGLDSGFAFSFRLTFRLLCLLILGLDGSFGFSFRLTFTFRLLCRSWLLCLGLDGGFRRSFRLTFRHSGFRLRGGFPLQAGRGRLCSFACDLCRLWL